MTTKRRIPHRKDLSQVVRLERPSLRRRQRRLRRALTIDDLRKVALRTTPRPVFDYTDGAAEDELAVQRAIDEYGRITFHPHVLRDVAKVDGTTTILGRPSPLPLVLAPTGFTRMMQHEGERAVAAAARDADLIYTLSTMGTTPVEDVVPIRGDASAVWFQLYLWKDRARSQELIQRVADAGVGVLVVTVDVPVAGARLRDVRNGLTIPPRLSLYTLAKIAQRPSWWFNMLTTEPLTFASLASEGAALADIINSTFDPSITLDDIRWLRQTWTGKLVVKGIQRTDDATDVVQAGVDAIVLSNHGGRQLDRAVSPLRLLPEVADAVGADAEILLDTGIRRGADIAAAVALGARAVLIGRAYLYGLMAGGQDGVARSIEILRDEFLRGLQLLGCTTLHDLTPDLITLPTP